MALEKDFVEEINAAVEQTVADSATAKAEQNQEEGETNGEQEGVAESGGADKQRTNGGGVEAAKGSDRGTGDGGEGDDSGDDGDGSGGEKSAASGAGTAVTISDYALTRAVHAGLTIEDARHFPSDDALLRAVDRIEAVLQSSEKTAETREEEDPFVKLPKLDPEQYEPEVIQMFDALTDVVKKQHETIKSFQARQDEAAQSFYGAAAREVEDWFNGQVKKLGEDFNETLGVGDYSSLPRGGQQLAKRDAVANHMAIMIAGYQTSGSKMPSREQIFDLAVKAVLGDDIQKIREAKLSNDLDKRSKQHVARAGGKKTSPVSEGNAFDDVAALVNAKFFSKGR